MPVSTECPAALLSFRYPSIILGSKSSRQAEPVLPMLLGRVWLVELALAERDSKNAGVFFFVGLPYIVGHAFLAETVETRNKNRDDLRCMQMSLVMSMRFIFGDD